MKKWQEGKYPTKLKADEIWKLYEGYLQHCKDEKMLLPNIAGFCCFADISRETYYEWRANDRKGLSDTIKRIDKSLEDQALQCKDAAKSIFYLKNKFGYKDKIETELSGKVEQGLSDADRALMDKIAKRMSIE